MQTHASPLGPSPSSFDPPRAHPAKLAITSILMTPSALLEDVCVILWSLLKFVFPGFPAWDVRVQGWWSHVVRAQSKLIEWLWRHLAQLQAHARNRWIYFQSRDADERDRLRVTIRHEFEVVSRPYRRLIVIAVAIWVLWFLFGLVFGTPDDCTRCREMLKDYPLGSTVGKAICLPETEKPSPACFIDPHINFMTEPTLAVSQTSPYCPGTRVQRKCAESITISDDSKGPFSYENIQACHLQMLLAVKDGSWPCGG